MQRLDITSIYLYLSIYIYLSIHPSIYPSIYVVVLRIKPSILGRLSTTELYPHSW
jgi:hypothetical protein